MSKFFSKEELQIEACENFQKQSYRNRCEILCANGTLSLFVPIIKGKDQRTPIREIEIDYVTEWQKQHFKSIESAYNSSPFYEYIIDDFKFVFEKKERFLFDLNLKILETLRTYIPFEKDIILSPGFVKGAEFDFKNSIHPKAKMKLPDPQFKAQSYYQTFNDRFDFIPNLSVLDLLFNEGPQAFSILKQSLL